MKKFTHKVAILLIALFSLTPSPSNADIFGAGDAALLAQQIAQFLQDLALDNKKWQDIRNRLKQVDDVAKTITKGKNGYTSIKNIVSATDNTLHTLREIDWYIEYLTEFSDNFSINRAHYIYKDFVSRSNAIIKEVGVTIKSFDYITDVKPLELLDAMDKVTKQTSNQIAKESSTAIDELHALYKNNLYRNMARQYKEFKKLNIRS